MKNHAYLDDLSYRLVSARKILNDNGGAITLRRLHRREYQNTIEDLIDFSPNVANVPDNQALAGFGIAGASLYFSSDHLEQLVSVARDALELV